MLRVTCILHPTDFSQTSRFAFETACALAHDYKAKLIVLHVHPMPDICGAGSTVPEFDAETCASAQQELNRVTTRDPEIEILRRFERGVPALDIVKCAEQEHCDLIVMGSHGRTGWSRRLMGSTAEAVLRTAPCPVLTITRPAKRESGEEPFVLEPASASLPASQQWLEELVSVLQLQAKQIERLVTHVEQHTPPLAPPLDLTLVVSQLSYLHSRVRWKLDPVIENLHKHLSWSSQ